MCACVFVRVCVCVCVFVFAGATAASSFKNQEAVTQGFVNVTWIQGDTVASSDDGHGFAVRLHRRVAAEQQFVLLVRCVRAAAR